jgi:hypothetical protein
LLGSEMDFHACKCRAGISPRQIAKKVAGFVPEHLKSNENSRLQ